MLVIDQIVVMVSVTGLVMVMPGPDMILVVRNTFADGRGAGLRTCAGILSGNVVHITYCVLGIGLIISQSILAFATLKYAAAAYLIYLGITTLRSESRPLEIVELEGHKHGGWFVQGLVNNLLNPKGTLFYLGVFTSVIVPETSSGTILVLVCVMLLVSATFWLAFVYAIDRPIVRDVLGRSQLTVNRMLGAVFVLLGIRVAAMSR